MPHLTPEVAEEWLREDFQLAPGDPLVSMINLSNLKHAIVPLYYAHVAGDAGKRFLHVTRSTVTIRGRIDQDA